ncbi:GGDEF domain-containing protein [Devosia sp. 2618]|uniref:GGDEF domain-containing protein n=1 Tax=Devosia sp. 2618 TaxID=3156454 RepID=UPI0033937B28
MSSRIAAQHLSASAPQTWTQTRDDFSARLVRMCDLLGIAGARLVQVTADQHTVIAAFGDATPNLNVLEAMATADTAPLVIADTLDKQRDHCRFYAGMTVPADADRPAMLLSLFDSRPRSAAMANTIAALAHDALSQVIIERQRREIAIQSATIARQIEVERQRRCLFDRASATARIGIWECDLSDGSLRWTNGVYDLFELPHGSPIARDTTLPFYSDECRRDMEAMRAHAIANCSDFALTAKITTAKGNTRWMRLTAAVEAVNGKATRIFGMKQDITEEKLLGDHTRYLAEFDVMTGLANRSQFQTRLDMLNDGSSKRQIGALLLMDLDGFKQINDTHGHALGDECIKEAAARLTESSGTAELVARIGGDEFAVLLGADLSLAEIEQRAQAIVEMVAQPLARMGHTMALSASVGVALYRGGSAEDLFRQADTALYAAKAAGRNTTMTFPIAA